jgi:hypothetical protein
MAAGYAERRVGTMLRAEVGDQLVRTGRTIAHAEVVGVIIQVHGRDGRPPYTVRWYEDSGISKCTPDAATYWVRPSWGEDEIGTVSRHRRTVA